MNSLRANRKTQFEGEDTGGDGPTRALSNPYKTKAEAQVAAKANAFKQNRGRASGFFERTGLVSATAEVDVITSEYGQGVDGFWCSEQVDQTFKSGSAGGYITRINVKAPEVPRAQSSV